MASEYLKIYLQTRTFILILSEGKRLGCGLRRKSSRVDILSSSLKNPSCRYRAIIAHLIIKDGNAVCAVMSSFFNLCFLHGAS